MSAIEPRQQTPSTGLAVTQSVRELFLGDLRELPPTQRADALARRFLLSYTGHTRAAYGRDLADWFGWCAALEIDPLAANRAMVDGYARHLEARRSPATIARRLSALAGFYRYAIAEEVLTSSPAAHIKRPKTANDSQTLGMDRGEARAFLAAAKEHSTRAGALVTLLLHDGLRISEALGADVGDLSHARGHRILTITRKGGARRDVVLNPATSQALDAYLDARVEGPVFITSSGNRWHRSEAFRLVRRLGTAAGIEHADKLSPHSLRHTFVTLAREAGVPLEDVQDAAGHADPRTTRRYDRGRHNLDRHPAYALGAFLAD
ncbi:tyrosine-type recombinase/integrase [Nocardioides albertanoniae]|uniref:tyrosine-type recombinase/integrase n=1 Tax=Nocardioides albertanoniae TaxID=1175486 RepID=UPI001B878ACA|nr:tyrosine-type recombinase/integrase [Nocardioides albertanoniae]